MSHDIDRTALELTSRLADYSVQDSEFAYSAPAEAEQGVFDEAQEMELAAELLGVSDDAELDQFLGSLIQQAGSAIGKAVRSPVGQKLGGFLKGAVKKALPAIGGIAGSYLGGPLGGAVGSKLGAAAGDVFGLELEGLSPEDQEYEVARRFVRFAGEATKQACRRPAGEPHATARRATLMAAQKHAPGLLRGGEQGQQEELATPPSKPSTAQSGRWVRQGRTIVLYGL